jgi:hypothetical protein
MGPGIEVEDRGPELVVELEPVVLDEDCSAKAVDAVPIETVSDVDGTAPWAWVEARLAVEVADLGELKTYKVPSKTRATRSAVEATWTLLAPAFFKGHGSPPGGRSRARGGLSQ